MKTTTYLLILIAFISCNKMQHGFKIENQGKYDLIVTTPDNSYLIPPYQTINIKSSSDDFNNFVYIYDADVKPIYTFLGTHPIKHISVRHYTHNFAVFVGDELKGTIDTVEIRINHKYYKQPIPFYYGTDKIPDSYNVTSKPNRIGYTHTIIQLEGKTIDMYNHTNSETGKLIGYLK